MTINELLARLEGVKGGGGQWSARCPAHDDRRASLSVSIGREDRILLNCHAGCRTEDIAAALGVEMKDLFADVRLEDAFTSTPPLTQGQQKPPVVARYDYRDSAGNLAAQKLRYADKRFTWRRPDGQGGWLYNRKGVPNLLYIQGDADPGGAILLAEGEKDVDTLAHRLGFPAASGMDGAGHGKWKPEYTRQLQGRAAAILPDHDQVGREYALEVAGALHEAGIPVRLLDLAAVWPEIPEHGDITDLADAVGDSRARELMVQLLQETKDWEPKKDDPLLTLFRPLEDFAEEEARWLVPGWLPEDQITLLAADGGTGKTSLWVDIVAAVSNGQPSILDPPETAFRQAGRVLFLSTEDSVTHVLRRKARLAGANMKNILTPDFQADKEGVLRKLKFGSPELARMIRYFKPVLCIFDPVQGFLPPKVNMGSRNEMRDCLAPLVSLGEECGTSFIIVCHSNKRKNAFGRDRIADSADLWDISRSVIMMGNTPEQGIRYISQEKSSYGPLQQTILYSITDQGQLQKEGTSWKRDREYQAETALAVSKPKREDCKGFVVETLEQAGGSMPTDELEEKAKEVGYSFATLKRAKGDLRKAERVKFFSTGGNKDKVWHIQLVIPEAPALKELPNETPVPFEPEQLAVDQ